MTTSNTPGRIYGEEYKRSERLDFSELVEHMYARLLLTPATSVVPAGTKYALHHNGDQVLALAVLGLRDAFLFSGERFTCEAEELHNALEDFSRRSTGGTPATTWTGGSSTPFTCSVNANSAGASRVPGCT